MQVGQACAAIRSIGAAGIHGQTPTASLVVDEAGLEHGMARFTITQFTSATPIRLETDSAPVTAYLQAADCADAEEAHALGEAVAAAPVSMAATETVRTASITTPAGTVLEVATDLVARDPLYRLVDGEPMRAPSLLTVSGADYSHVLSD
ncbi:hypothetical protein [Georgenia subflava]|uniref:hypothetical protein n=1 Tax=Georgenia subflava TaxID=1622177 RepID=UPI00187B1A33|nr:hypothetical protein [Georgenia subflava]